MIFLDYFVRLGLGSLGLGHFGCKNTEFRLLLPQLDQLVDVSQDELFHIIDGLVVVLDHARVETALIYLLRKQIPIQVDDNLVLGLNELALILVGLLLLDAQLILLDVPLQVLVHFGHGVAPAQTEAEDHVVDVLVECFVHIVVEELQAYQLEYLFVVLPILQLLLLYLVFSDVRSVLDQVN